MPIIFSSTGLIEIATGIERTGIDFYNGGVGEREGRPEGIWNTGGNGTPTPSPLPEYEERGHFMMLSGLKS